MAQIKIFEDALSNSTNRRSLLKRLAVASAALGVVSAQTTTPTNPTNPITPATPAPADVIQFALNLEYLEAEFYSVAASGLTLAQRGIAISGSGNGGATTTGFGVALGFGSNAAYRAVQNIAADEINHVIGLRAALTANGVTPIAKPAINLDALASLGPSLGNQQSFFILARIFEDIGVSAYAGAAGFLVGSPYLAMAARILAVEGEHAGNIRLQCGMIGLPTSPIDAADVIPPPSGTNYFSTNTANGLCATRTPGQVLYLAYGNAANATSGGFFPNGVNGSINTSSGAAPATNLN